ncbi:PREDICTED: G-protein coupled receptor family C group 5 member B [Myotis davidii]|uniref:G-protein coupled receptor family C group 5 member B n=1 Tax=Myotis davidii TaxID=225400 RepID=UPI000767590B|nr:PREDICTED: G-protein coupled receptor family C group 5 member B [Myotis davidii]
MCARCGTGPGRRQRVTCPQARGGGRTHRAERKMGARGALALLLLCAAAAGASENSSTSRGCGLDLLPQYVSLCDLDSVWGIVVEAAAGAGALITLLLMLILLVRLPFITEQEKRDPVGLHFLFLLGTLGLFGLTFAFIIREDEAVYYFDAPPPRVRETAFEEDAPLPRTYLENKAFSMDEHSAALRTAGFRNGSLGSRPSAPFRSNVYQPTEMAVVLNGGTIPTAPPSYMGRHLW